MKNKSGRAARVPGGETLLLQSFILASLLAVAKLAAAIATGSLGILASALDSGMDLLSTAANYITYRISQRPPDKDHPYGHGKAESIAGTAQGIVISFAAAALLFESVRRAAGNSRPSVTGWTIAVMAAACVLSGFHGWRLNHAYRRTGSLILRAEGLHFSMDILSNAAVLGALLVVRSGGAPVLDVLVSLLVAGYVLREALGIFGESIQDVMDRKLPQEMEDDIRGIIKSHPTVAGFHDLRTRRSGKRVFIDFHAEISGDPGFREAHAITEDLIDRIKGRFPGADVTVHADPEGDR